MIETDILIVGSEGAGARAAIVASDSGASVIIATKGRMGKSGATITGVGGMAVDSQSATEMLGLPGDRRDSPEEFYEDIMVGGKHINHQRLVEVLVKEAGPRIKEMLEWGMKITTIVQTPGHRFPRSMLTSGSEIMRVLKKEVKKRGVKVIDDVMITDLMVVRGRVVGAVGLDLRTGSFISVKAKATILATGGGMMAYMVQTAPEDLTGDGQAMAWRAGARLVDMEMTQFHPCNLLTPPIWSGIGFPYTIGPGGGLNTWLLNKWGERFMAKWDPERMERTTRDVMSIAIMTEVMEGRGSPAGGVYLSLSHLPHNLISDFGKWYFKDFMKEEWTFGKFDFRGLAEELKSGYAMEVGPASHFFMGGIYIDEDCQTTLPGLFAAGEVAGGLNGANRLSDVAYTQILVQGARAGKAAARFARVAKHSAPTGAELARFRQRIIAPLERQADISSFELKRHIQRMAWEKVGVIRTSAGLQEAQEEIDRLKKNEINRISCRAKEEQYNREWIEAIQIDNLITLLSAITKSAALRVESRGAHYRKDFPHSDNDRWLKNIFLDNDDGKMQTSTGSMASKNLV
jgi:succinate dehydrogenase/fumarate reductase flavoprotein subunit